MLQNHLTYVDGGAYAQMPTTKNIERQMVSVGDPISQKNATSGFTWEKFYPLI